MRIPGPVPHSKKLLLIGLAALVLVSFSGVFQHDFIHYDDHVYVTDNPHVRGGLTVEGVRWALTATDAGFWHPLTWLSLMADAQLFRLNPGGFHGTSLLLHLATTALLFLVLSGLTGSIGKSAFVAALFGVHPLQVEPVAWVAARKDVLCAFFWVAAMGAYGWYALRPGVLRYGVLAAAFGLIGVVQALLLLGVAVAAFNVMIVGTVALAFFIIALLCVVSLSLGILLSTLAESELQAIQMIPLIVLPSFLLAGIFWPVEAIPPYLRPLSYLIPPYWAIDACRSIMIRGWGIGRIYPHALVLAAFAAVFLRLAVLTLRRRKS